MKRTVAAGATVLATLTLTACGTQDPFAEETPAPSSAAEPGTVVIGTANFPESEIIGQIWAEALRKEGFDVEVSSGIGSREVYLGALQEGSVNVVPEYSGNLTQFYGGGELADALPEDLVAGELSPAESKDAYRVTRDLADEQGLVTIADLDKLDTITIAAPPEFAQRPYGPEGLTTVYGIDAGKIKVNPISDGGGPLTVQALVEGAANVANIFTTSPALLKNGEEADLVILEDPENLIPPQNIVPVIKAGSLPDGALDVINSVDAQLTTEDVVAMNMRNVGPERAEPATIAKDFVASLD
ncbi:ABC transporter substrate-binding protein [Corynebacterium qintianiae]|uniref:ABC transporter substrate-binding protein n=1 Tax=Corynebacterium qintianiae TaxID=2709392 RepID=A0A7T0KPB9_9CORY|nr:ABC transporter substrate-binding protein [Corynebacterium qintianiae]QPK83890.1 ABC transporter substrate-binding protein [Corynebacterium qintianiae]